MSIQSSYKSCSDGYKQTEIGVIPEDWEVKQIGDIGGVRMCKRIFSFQTEDEGDIPFYKIGTFGKKADSFISKKLFEEFKNKYPYPKRGEILISASGTIGRTVVYDGEIAYFQDSNIVWIENNENLVTNQFLYYIYKSIKFNTEGSTIKRLYNNLLLSISFKCPTLEEQKAIAQVLSDTDQLIQNLKTLITKKKAIKQGIMQELLTGKKRLQGFTEKWIINTLNQVSESLVRGPFGGALKKEFFVNKGYKVYEQKNAIYKDENLGEYYIDENKFKELKRFEITSGDFIVSCSGTIGSIFKIPNKFKKGVINQALLKISLDKEIIDDDYFYYLFTSKPFQSQIIDDTQGGAMKNLVGMSVFKETEIKMPSSLKEQQAIAQILSDMDAEIEALEQQLQKTQALKQGMMQELLTGKIRLVSEHDYKINMINKISLNL